ncbi:hypothetical protein HDU78_002867 [Chytriomyces hyalinus]|nr:hypothetical protein HDU78_002867 [Chytriomyces hyalinus]KAJ3250593.1 hypothetical protein HDU77_006503 [Chytriomyces hyalinus]
MGTAAEEAGWTSLLLPLLFFTVSTTVLMLLSWQTISNRVTYSPFQKRLLQLMLVWAVIRTLSFFFRILVSLVPSLGDNDKFVSFTRVMLSVGGAPLTRVVTKNCLTSFLGIKIFPRSQSSRFQAWNQNVSIRKLAVSRTQACLDAILLTAMVFLVFSTIAYEVQGHPTHARWPVLVLALTLVQSTLLVIRYAYTIAYFLATVKFPVQLLANETQLYLCSLVPVFLMAGPFCLEWVVAMFQLDIVDEQDRTTRDTVHFGVATDMVAQAALSTIS